MESAAGEGARNSCSGFVTFTHRPARRLPYQWRVSSAVCALARVATISSSFIQLCCRSTMPCCRDTMPISSGPSGIVHAIPSPMAHLRPGPTRRRPLAHSRVDAHRRVFVSAHHRSKNACRNANERSWITVSTRSPCHSAWNPRSSKTNFRLHVRHNLQVGILEISQAIRVEYQMLLKLLKHQCLRTSKLDLIV